MKVCIFRYAMHWSLGYDQEWFARLIDETGTPAWVLPVAIGGGVVAFLAVAALIVFLVIKKWGGNRSREEAAANKPGSEDPPMK